MKFCEKLQMLRKERGYSQEHLADLLDVSRQAVSKWESGTTYPEMDKLLAICKIFNVTLDDLTNDEVSKKNMQERKKNNFSNLIYTIIEMFEKSIEIFKNMKGKEIGKFIFDFGLLIVILLFCKIPFIYLDGLLENLFTSLNISYTIYIAFYSICSFIIKVIYFILFISILIYFYKTRYLDKWNGPKEESIDSKKEKYLKEEDKEEIRKIKKVKERNFVLFDVLGSLISFFIKIFLFFLLLGLCFIFVAFVFILVLTIIASSKGIMVIGLLILALSLVLGVGVLINLNIAWLFNQPTHYKSLLIIFFTSLILFASGGAIFSYEMTGYSFINEAPINALKKEKTYTFKMKDNTYLSDYDMDIYRNLTFLVNENLTEEIKYHISYYADFQEIMVNETANDTIYTNFSYSFQTPKIMGILIQNLKNKTLYNYDKLKTITIVVETSSKNIEKLKNNCLSYEKKWYENELTIMEEQYQEEIENLTRENEKLENEKYKYIEKIDELQEKINELEEDLFN